ncbi:cytochrome P450 [Xylaria sp. FL0043]|nr:cytochrome P450 [Xylaria sp. FL0043]
MERKQVPVFHRGSGIGLYERVSPAKSMPDILLIKFDEDNSKERHISGVLSSLRKGYDLARYGRPYCIRDYLNPNRPRPKNTPQENLSLSGISNKLSEVWPAVAMEYITCVLAAQAACALLGAKYDDRIQKAMGNYYAKGMNVTGDQTVQNTIFVMHGTAFIALQSLFGLLGTPNALAEIREEIEDRYAMTPYTFKNGLHIPAGTVVSCPNLRYNADSSTASLPNAGTSDGKHAYDRGGGSQACPGRIMTGVTIKLILFLIHLITRCSMKLSERRPEPRRVQELYGYNFRCVDASDA